MKKWLALNLYLLLIVSVANAGTLVMGDVRISGGDLVFSDGSVQSTAQVRGPAGPQGPPGQVTLAAICAAIKTANVAMPTFCPEPVSTEPATEGILSVDASATGSTIGATATYTNPHQTNLIGVPITFSVQIGGMALNLGTHSTNNSGSVGIAFSPPPFSGTQTITVIARTGNLTDFASLTMSGRSLTVTAPPALNLTTGAAGGTSVPFTIAPLVNFVTITDPFTNSVNGHPLAISATLVANNPADTLSVPTATTSGSVGVAPFPGASGTLVVPALVGGAETMTITWTVTDTITGQSGTAITTVTLTKGS